MRERRQQPDAIERVRERVAECQVRQRRGQSDCIERLIKTRAEHQMFQVRRQDDVVERLVESAAQRQVRQGSQRRQRRQNRRHSRGGQERQRQVQRLVGASVLIDADQQAVDAHKYLVAIAAYGLLHNAPRVALNKGVERPALRVHSLDHDGGPVIDPMLTHRRLALVDAREQQDGAPRQQLVGKQVQERLRKARRSSVIGQVYTLECAQTKLWGVRRHFFELCANVLRKK